MVTQDSSRIRIVLAGRTGAGKTTLITTFRKAYSGPISDMGNTTKVPKSLEPKDYDSLQATFVDCPGFQHPAAMSQYLRQERRGPERLAEFLQDCKDDKIDLTYDRLACEALKQSDVVLYVADANNPAVDAHTQDVRVIQKIQPRIVGILNKTKKLTGTKGEEGKSRRIEQWKKKIREMDVYEIVSFDAHWDKPSKVIKIYDAIKDILPPELQASFEDNLESFYERQRQIHEKAYQLLYEQVLKIREKKLEQKVEEDDTTEAKKQLEDELINFFNNCVDRFITKATELYQIAAENPTLSPDDFPLSYMTYTQGAGLGKRATYAATVGTLGSFAGAALAATGMAAFVFFTGGAGPAIAAAAISGATYGGVGVGTLGAMTGGLSAYDTICSLNLSSSDIPKRLAEYLMTVIYALSHHGYGAKPEISRNQFEELLNKVRKINDGKEQNIDWVNAKKDDIYNWCKETLKKLED